MATITKLEIKALQYVKDTDGTATRKQFIEDMEPLGITLWRMLEGRYIITGMNSRLFLTPVAKHLIKQETGSNE